LFVYIHEAHPDDGWQVPENQRDDVIVNQPKTADERRAVAAQCCTKLKLTMPCVIDTQDNKTDEAYAAWPERMFIIGADGKIAYAGKVGPSGFKPQEVEAWLRERTAPPKKP
jgi:type I thyroxine 5'-deiodinase